MFASARALQYVCFPFPDVAIKTLPMAFFFPFPLMHPLALDKQDGKQDPMHHVQMRALLACHVNPPLPSLQTPRGYQRWPGHSLDRFGLHHWFWMAYGLDSYQADLGGLPPPWEACVSECVYYNDLGGDISLLDFCGYLFLAFTWRYTPKVGRILYWMKQNID